MAALERPGTATLHDHICVTRAPRRLRRADMPCVWGDRLSERGSLARRGRPGRQGPIGKGRESEAVRGRPRKARVKSELDVQK